MNLESLRKEIDKIDEELLSLLMKRYKYVKEIGNLKLKANHNIYVPEREKHLLSRLDKLNNGVIPNNTIKAIFTEIISGGRQIEHPITVICKQSKPFLHAYAAYEKLGKSISLLFLKSYKEIFLKVKESYSHYSIILFEDSEKGLSAAPLLDFLDSGLSICSEIIINNPEKQGNWKRFLLVGNKATKPACAEKTLIYFTPKETAGNRIQDLLAGYDIKTRIIGTLQLSKKSVTYIFAEFFKNTKDDSLSELLHTIKKNSSFLKILGSFPAS